MKKRNRIWRILVYIFLLVSSFCMVYPIIFMVLGAFTTGDRFLTTTILPIPNTLNIDLFKWAFRRGILEGYTITFLRVGFYVLITLAVSITAGYVFSKMRFPGKNQVFLIFLSGMVMPQILMMVPMYLLAAWFPLAGGNNIFGQGGHGFIWEWPVLFLYGWVPPLAIFLMKQNYDMLPREYEEAARMDGAGTFTIIFRIYGPLLKPTIAALVIITFLAYWNDYLWPSLTITTRPEYYPIALKIRSLTPRTFWSPFGTTNFPAVMVQYFLVTLPPAIVYFLLQRYFVQGLVASGLKG